MTSVLDCHIGMFSGNNFSKISLTQDAPTSPFDDNFIKISLTQDAPTSPFDDNCDSTRPCDSTISEDASKEWLFAVPLSIEYPLLDQDKISFATNNRRPVSITSVSTSRIESLDGYSIYDTLDEFTFRSYLSDDDFELFSGGSGKIDKEVYDNWHFLDYGLKEKIEDTAAGEDAADEDADTYEDDDIDNISDITENDLYEDSDNEDCMFPLEL